MGNRVARLAVEYYVALRINIVAATSFWPFIQPREPQPIVRIAAARLLGGGGFDAREMWIAADGDRCVVTLPQRQASSNSAPRISLN